MDNKEFVEYLIKLGACHVAVLWVADHGGTADECWHDCQEEQMKQNFDDLPDGREQSQMDKRRDKEKIRPEDKKWHREDKTRRPQKPCVIPEEENGHYTH